MKFVSRILVCSFALVSSSLSQEEAKSYVLADRKRPIPVGETLKIVDKDAVNEAPFSIEIEGRKIEGKMTMSSRKVVKYEFLALDRVRATYLTDISSGKRSMAGNEQEINERKATEGRSFLVVKKDGKWTVDPKPEDVELVDQEDIDEAIKDLERAANEENKISLKMYGEKPRKVGDIWEVEAPALPGMGGVEIIGGKITLKFIAVEEVNGEPCAMLRAKFKVTGQMTEDSMKGVGVDLSGTLQITRSLKDFVDLKVVGTVGMKMVGETQLQPGLVGTMKMEGDTKMELKAIRMTPAKKE